LKKNDQLAQMIYGGLKNVTLCKADIMTSHFLWVLLEKNTHSFYNKLILNYN